MSISFVSFCGEAGRPRPFGLLGILSISCCGILVDFVSGFVCGIVCVVN